jgi:Immunity protein 8
MHAELRGIYSPDVLDPDLAAYQPEDPESFVLRLGAFIGPSEPPLGEELFTFTVCTARWLASHSRAEGSQFLRGTILVTRWDYLRVERAIKDLCLRTDRETWEDVTTALNQYGKWEFDDYRPD